MLRGGTRGEILDALLSAPGPGDALARLRRAMRAHTFPATPAPVALRQLVDSLDARTQREGLHVLQGWDYVAHQFPAEIAPVLLLDYCARLGAHAGRQALAILLDQYFLSVLSLLAVRAWDDGDANENLDRVSGLLRDLQGPQGSGHRFINDAETLLLLAVAYYHPEARGYALILEKVRTLDAAHRLRFALPCAGIMASHLRWGLRFMYRRDVGVMRDDNVVDYPWLLFALLTLMRAYSRLHDALEHGPERERVVEGLLNGLSADPWAFVGKAPAFLAPVQAEHDEFRELFSLLRADLLEEFERQQPSAKTFSPLAFACNFLSNAIVAMVVIAIGDEKGESPSLNALFTRARDGVSEEASAERLARRLLEFAGGSDERLRAGGAPLIAFDPYDGISCYNAVVRTIRSEGASGQRLAADC